MRKSSVSFEFFHLPRNSALKILAQCLPRQCGFNEISIFALIFNEILHTFRMKYTDSDSDDEDYNVDFDETKLPIIEIPPGDHKLQHCYHLWYARKGSHKASEYGKSLHFIGRCATVEQWWSLYCHLLRPTELKTYRKLHLFKAGVKPMWEDPENIKGGKWILRLRKNKVNRAWENVCMAMLVSCFFLLLCKLE